MSTEIKPGQVWAWKDEDVANGGPGDTFRIAGPSPSEGHWTYSYVGASVEEYGAESMYVASSDALNRAATLVKDATPAPFDPTRVKAGDTVTAVVTPVGHAPEYIVKGEVWASSSGSLYVGPIELRSPRVSILSHQPAPEPEPEWSGKFVSAVVDVNTDGRRFERRSGFVSKSSGREDAFYLLADSGYQTRRDMSEVTDVRPLVVLDPAEVDVDYHATRLAWGTYGLPLQQLTDAQAQACRAQVRTMLAGLGIEASS